MGGLEPRNIMTDQDKAMKAAIALVFPDVVHRCYKFHVVSKACEKLGWLINSSEEFANEFDSCINHTETPEEFELMWHSLEEKYNLHKKRHFRTCQLLGQCGRQHTSGNCSSLSQALQEGRKV